MTTGVVIPVAFTATNCSKATEDGEKRVIPTGYLDIENGILKGIRSECLKDVTRQKLNHLSIPAEVREIANSAFKGMQFIQSVDPFSTVTFIGDSAFEGCTSLTWIDFSENANLEHIGNKAFFDCSLKLLDLRFQSRNFEYLGDYAFARSFGRKADEFSCLKDFIINCNFLEIVGAYGYVGVDILQYSAYSGQLSMSVYNYGGNTTINDADLSNVVDPNDVEECATWGFAQRILGSEGPDYLASLKLVGITGIGSYAFAGCYRLGNLDFSSLKTVEFIGAYAFYGLYYNGSEGEMGLTSLDLTKNENIRVVDDFAFAGCQLLSEIRVPIDYRDSGKIIVDTLYGDSVFADCAEHIIFEVKGVDSEVSRIRSGNSSDYFAYKMFGEATDRLTSVTFTNISVVGAFAFYQCSNIIRLNFMTEPNEIETSAFQGCAALVNPNIGYISGEPTISMCEGDFGVTSNYAVVELPDFIDETNFVWTIRFPQLADPNFTISGNGTNNGVLAISENTPENVYTFKIVATDTVNGFETTRTIRVEVRVQPDAKDIFRFDELTGLITGFATDAPISEITTLTIPAQIDDIDVVGVESFAFAIPGGENYISTIPSNIKSLVIETNVRTANVMPQGVGDINASSNAGVFSIGTASFGRAPFETVTFKKSDELKRKQKETDDEEGRPILQTVIIDLGAELTSQKQVGWEDGFGDRTYGFAFAICSDLKSVSFWQEDELDMNVAVGPNAFYQCKKLENFDFSNTVMLGTSSFEECTSIQKVEFSEALMAMGTKAFKNCSSLNEIKFNTLLRPDLMDLNPDPMYMNFFGYEFIEDNKLEEIFAGISPTGTVIIPKGTETAIRTIEINWMRFLDECDLYVDDVNWEIISKPFEAMNVGKEDELNDITIFLEPEEKFDWISNDEIEDIAQLQSLYFNDISNDPSLFFNDLYFQTGYDHGQNIKSPHGFGDEEENVVDNAMIGGLGKNFSITNGNQFSYSYQYFSHIEDKKDKLADGFDASLKSLFKTEANIELKNIPFVLVEAIPMLQGFDANFYAPFSLQLEYRLENPFWTTDTDWQISINHLFTTMGGIKSDMLSDILVRAKDMNMPNLANYFQAMDRGYIKMDNVVLNSRTIWRYSPDELQIIFEIISAFCLRNISYLNSGSQV